MTAILRNDLSTGGMESLHKGIQVFWVKLCSKVSNFNKVKTEDR